MKYIILFTLFLVGCTSKIDKINSVKTKYPNSELFEIPSNDKLTQFLVRQKDGSVYYVQAYNDGTIRSVKAFESLYSEAP